MGMGVGALAKQAPWSDFWWLMLRPPSWPERGDASGEQATLALIK